VEDKMRPPDPIIISIGRTIMNLGKYIVYNIRLILRKGDDYLSDRIPIWFSNTRYYENKRIEDNALKSVVKIRTDIADVSVGNNSQRVRQTSSMFHEQNIRDWKGTDHTPLDLGYKEMKTKISKSFHLSRKEKKAQTSKMSQRRFNEGDGDNFPDVVMNGNWKPIQR